MTTKTLMVLGTSSDAGKSWVTSGICRLLSDRGLNVAPFKAQNMNSLSVEVVPHIAGIEDLVGAPKDLVGGTAASTVTQRAEVGSVDKEPAGSDFRTRCGRYSFEISLSQFVQSVAARCDADTRMNPVLLKPTSDTGSRVVVDGIERPDITAMEWKVRKRILWPHVTAAFDSLSEDFDVIVIEGAGSPAEINLVENDIVNMSVARYTNSSCLLVSDIDRGGAFAHLYGTWALLDVDDRRHIKGFVLNKFRGDAALLDPAPEILTDLTGVETISVIPMLSDLGLDFADLATLLSSPGDDKDPSLFEQIRIGKNVRDDVVEMIDTAVERVAQHLRSCGFDRDIFALLEI